MAGLKYMVPATEKTFDEQQYIWGNPDIEIALKDGYISSATDHFFAVRIREGRNLYQKGELLARKGEKTHRIIQELLREGASPMRHEDGTLDFLTPALREMAG